MITTATARMLTRYNAWSNKLMYDAVAALPEGEATKERKSLFKNIVHTLNHIYVIDLIWQAHLEGREHGYTARNTPGHPPLAELWRSQQEIDNWYIAWSDKLSDAALDEKLSFELIGGNKGVMTRGEMLLHVVTSYELSSRLRRRSVLSGARTAADDGSSGVSQGKGQRGESDAE